MDKKITISESIKKSAQKNKTKIQSPECADLESILSNLFYRPKKVKEETDFIRHIITRGLESQERVGLHASAILKGDKQFCLRAQVLSLLFKQMQGQQYPPSLMRIFEEGNAIHEKWQRLFIRGGYSTYDQLDATQYNDTYNLQYTPDIICSIPEFYDGLMIGEIKSVNTYQYQKMQKHPDASKQLQLYMHFCIDREKENYIWNHKDYRKGFVLCEDKNTQEFKLEVYDYDFDVVSKYLDRLAEIKKSYKHCKQSKRMVKRPDFCEDEESTLCKKCAMSDACYNRGIGRVKI